MPIKTAAKVIKPSYTIKACREPTEADKKDIAKLSRLVSGTLINGKEDPIGNDEYLRMFSDFGIGGNATNEYVIPFNEKVSIPLGLVMEIDALRIREIAFDPHMPVTKVGIITDGDRMVVKNDHPRCRFLRDSELVA